MCSPPNALVIFEDDAAIRLAAVTAEPSTVDGDGSAVLSRGVAVHVVTSEVVQVKARGLSTAMDQSMGVFVRRRMRIGDRKLRSRREEL
jgi:hypothetical protein